MQYLRRYSCSVLISHYPLYSIVHDISVESLILIMIDVCVAGVAMAAWWAGWAVRAAAA